MEYKQDSLEAHIDKKFEIIQKIGSGAYGYVWKVKQKSTNQIYALKKVFLAFQNDVDAQRTYRQISILRQLNHPNVVKLKQVIKAQNSLDLYVIFQYIECDLFNAIRDGVLNQVHKKYIIYQLAKALYYLHSAGILHRDLKPSNVLIDANCKIKICDFGLSRTLHKYDDQQPLMTEFIATRWYRAPEVMFGSRKYAEKSDMWSLGCLIYQMYAARPLLPGADSVNQIEKVLEMKGFPTSDEMKDLNVDKLDVLLSHFKTDKNPQTHYFKQSWNPKLIQLIKNLLDYSPVKRWGTENVLKCQLIEQFHNYQELISAKTQVILRVSDNKKNDKQFYRNFINKFYMKKISRAFQKPLLRIAHKSQNPRKQAETSVRHKKLKNSAISLHGHSTTNNSLNNSILSKNVSRTLHCTVRNTNRQLKVPNKKLGTPQSGGPYNQPKTRKKQSRDSHKQSRDSHKQNCTPITRKKSEHRHLRRDIGKSIIKQEGSKKVLKRKTYLYNI